MVADSTRSTSPMEEHFSPVVKRAARTYGRKRTPEPEEHASPTFESPPPSNVFRTAPAKVTECIPPTSDNEAATDSDPEDASPAVKPYRYGWQKQLVEMDQSDDDAAALPRSGPAEVTTPETDFGKPSFLLGIAASTPSRQTPDNDMLHEQLDRRSPSQSHAGSPTPKTRPGQTRRSRRVVDESDSDAEYPTTTPPVNTSPPTTNDFTPAKARKSSTPPTPDNSMPTRRSSGKQKVPSDARRSVPPLDLLVSPPKGRKLDGDHKKKTVRFGLGVLMFLPHNRLESHEERPSRKNQGQCPHRR